MKEKIVNMKDFEKEAKRRQRKEWVHDRIQNAGNWIEDNKELILLIGPTLLGVGTAVIKSANKRATLKKEEKLKDLYCYDRSLGHYWKLKRELTNSEWVEIDKRKQNGERLADILTELKVLK